MHQFTTIIFICSLVSGLTPTFLQAASSTESVIQIIQSCDNKYAGEDQNTLFRVSVKNKQGREQKTIYRRYWKNETDNKDISDKLSLFTLSPPDAKNTAFLQHTFTKGHKKNAEQWLYLPSLRSIRRTSVRALSDSFLGTDLSFDDIRLRQINEDRHRLLNKNEDESSLFYLVESRPKETSSVYGRKLIHYEKNKKTQVCLKTEVTYYDKQNNMMKKQLLNWQKVGNAWLWETVIVKNAQTFSTSTFQISHAKVNTDLDDNLFTTRMLKQGIR